MPVRFKRAEEGYALEVKLSAPPLPRTHWKHVCYLSPAGALGLANPWGPRGRDWVAMLGDKTASPSRTRKGAVAAWVTALESELKRDKNRINFIRDAYDARLEWERLFVTDRQLIVEELRRHFPRADA